MTWKFINFVTVKDQSRVLKILLLLTWYKRNFFNIPPKIPTTLFYLDALLNKI
jgi:hypothetical protein